MTNDTQRHTRLLKNFDKTAILVHDYAVSRYGKELADSLYRTARQTYEQLIPHIPHTGGLPVLNTFLGIAAQELAVFKALNEHDKTASEAWEICHKALKARTDAMPKIVKRLIGWYLFTGFVKSRARKIAGRDLGGFTIEYVDAEGGWGVNYRQCAIYEFMKAHNADEFAPYVCLSDIVLSDAMGWGLKRTETLADGCYKCDFRFRKGARTEISSKNHKVQAIIDKITDTAG